MGDFVVAKLALWLIWALLKAALLIPICLIIMTGGFTSSALIMLPYDFFVTYRAVCCTGLINPVLKILVMLLIPIPLILWPCVVILGTILGAIYWPLYHSFKGTFWDDDGSCCGGLLFDADNEWCPVVRDVVNFTKDFWYFNKCSVPQYIDDIRNKQRVEIAPEAERQSAAELGGGKIVDGKVVSVPMGKIFDNLFILCEETIRDGLRRGVIKRDDIDSFAAFIFIGVPAAAVVGCASRSYKHNKRADVLKITDKLILTAGKRPRNYFADIWYNSMVNLKLDIGRANLLPEEEDALWTAALRQDADFIFAVDSDPKATELLSQATRMGIWFSRLPQFHRRFQDVIKNSNLDEQL